MRTREQILELLHRAKPELESRYRVRKIALFGSFARGDQRSGSDIDILVEVDPAIGLGFVELAERIEEVLPAAFNQDAPISPPTERDEPLATSTAS